jgi:hypothetical protein
VADRGATAEFERLYRPNVDAVTAYFARRSADPHVVADLTADIFGIARRDLSPDHIEELLDRIDAERAGRHLVRGGHREQQPR